MAPAALLPFNSAMSPLPPQPCSVPTVCGPAPLKRLKCPYLPALPCSRVISPTSLQLRISKSIDSPEGHKSQEGKPSSSRTSQRRARLGLLRASAPMDSGVEVRLAVPEIEAEMDTQEWAILTDVISNIGMSKVGTDGNHVKDDAKSIAGAKTRRQWHVQRRCARSNVRVLSTLADAGLHTDL